MKAELIIHNKVIDEHGNTVEIKLWTVEKSFDKPYGYKYSLVYIKDAKRVIGYDNAEQKGDHRHFGDTTAPYAFSSVSQLERDFYDDIALYNRGK